MNIDFENLKQEVEARCITTIGLQDQIREQNEMIQKLNNTLQQMQQEHQEQIKKVSQQISIQNEDAQFNFLKNLKNEIQKSVQSLEEQTDQQVNQLIEESKARIYEKVEQQKQEELRLQNSQQNIYRQSYVDQLNKEKQQLQKQLIIAQQNNIQKEEQVNQLKQIIEEIKQDLKKVINEDFLDANMNAEQLAEKLNDAQSITGYTEYSIGQYSVNSRDQDNLTDGSNLSNMGTNVNGPDGKQSSGKQQPKMDDYIQQAKSQYQQQLQRENEQNKKKLLVANKRKQVEHDQDNDLDDFLRIAATDKKRKITPHSRCELQIKKYGTQIMQLQQLINNMRNDLKDVIEYTIQSLRETGILQHAYMGGKPSLSQRDKEILASSMGRNITLVQALIRLGDFKSGGLGVNKRVQLLQQLQDQ